MRPYCLVLVTLTILLACFDAAMANSSPELSLTANDQPTKRMLRAQADDDDTSDEERGILSQAKLWNMKRVANNEIKAADKASAKAKREVEKAAAKAKKEAAKTAAKAEKEAARTAAKTEKEAAKTAAKAEKEAAKAAAKAEKEAAKKAAEVEKATTAAAKKSATEAYEVAKARADEMKLFAKWIGKKWTPDYIKKKLGLVKLGDRAPESRNFKVWERYDQAYKTHMEKAATAATRL